ncbi:unnamed protein product [Caenorhabditis brenneri]
MSISSPSDHWRIIWTDWFSTQNIGAVNEVLTQLDPVALGFAHNQVLQVGTLRVENETLVSVLDSVRISGRRADWRREDLETPNHALRASGIFTLRLTSGRWVRTGVLQISHTTARNRRFGPSSPWVVHSGPIGPSGPRVRAQQSAPNRHTDRRRSDSRVQNVRSDHLKAHYARKGVFLQRAGLRLVSVRTAPGSKHLVELAQVYNLEHTRLLELSHTRHILYQTEEELHVTNEVLASVQYENQMRKQQIDRIRGPKVDRQLPECPNCFETYGLVRAETKPRILHCGHTLCNQCIRGMMAAENTHRLYCPLCRFSCMKIAVDPNLNSVVEDVASGDHYQSSCRWVQNPKCTCWPCWSIYESTESGCSGHISPSVGRSSSSRRVCPGHISPSVGWRSTGTGPALPWEVEGTALPGGACRVEDLPLAEAVGGFWKALAAVFDFLEERLERPVAEWSVLHEHLQLSFMLL